jgi:acyl-CoA hydrolase
VRVYLQEIIREASASGAIVALVAVPRLSLLRASVGALSDSPIYAELAAEEGVLLIPGVFSDVLSDESLRADEIHPNARGYERLAQGMLSVFTEAGLIPAR